MSLLPRMWCPQCREWTVLIDTGYCLWCSGRLEDEHGRPAPERPRRRGVPRNIPDGDLLVAHRQHLDGFPLHMIAADRFREWGYASPRSAACALTLALRKHGLPVRVRGRLVERQAA